MNEEQIIKDRIGDANPFRVPDHYFDSLTDNVMANVMANGKTKTISVRLRRGMYAAACVAVIAVVAVSVLFGGDDRQNLASSRHKHAEDAYAETNETTVDELADLAMMDNSDIYAYLISDY